MYNTLEKAGVFQAFGAYDNDTLIGFIVVLVSNNPHYGKVIGTIESFFVSKAKRKTGAGLKLLRISEIFCKEFGAVGLFLSAPVESQLAKTMEKLSPYKETNRVFFRSL
jgi:predicted acetyltransferase